MKKKTLVLLSTVLLSSVITFSATKFIDVNSKDWFYNDVIKVSESGIMTGYKDGSFKPNQYVTRAEMAVIANKLESEVDSIKMITTANKSSGYIVMPNGATSSCVFVTQDIVLTSKHVTDEFEDNIWIPVITHDEQHYYGKVVNSDSESDLSMIKLDKMSDVTPIVIAENLDVLENIYAFGSPMGLSNTITFGKVSAFNRDLDGKTMTQFDIQVMSGMSGGAIVNSRGELVGIISSKLTNTGIAFGSRLVDIVDFLHGRKK